MTTYKEFESETKIEMNNRLSESLTNCDPDGAFVTLDTEQLRSSNAIISRFPKADVYIAETDLDRFNKIKDNISNKKNISVHYGLVEDRINNLCKNRTISLANLDYCTNDITEKQFEVIENVIRNSSDTAILGITLATRSSTAEIDGVSRKLRKGNPLLKLENRLNKINRKLGDFGIKYCRDVCMLGKYKYKRNKNSTLMNYFIYEIRKD